MMEIMQIPGRAVRRFYVDVHRLANKRRKNKTEENYHVYIVDGEAFGKASKIADIPAEAGDELYVDVIPIELTDEFVEVLRRGVRVYHLRRLTMLRQKREELRLSKTARNDLRALMRVEKKWFREIDEDFLEMRRLISAFQVLLRNHQSLLNGMRALNKGVEREILREAIRCTERQMAAMAARIVEEAGRRIPTYNKVVEALEIAGENHLLAREALAELLTYVDFNRGIEKINNYVGLFKPAKGRLKIYYRLPRQALQRLTIALKGTSTIKAKDQVQVIKRIRETVLTRTPLEAEDHAGLGQQGKTLRPV
jgi:hypothetical protein